MTFAPEIAFCADCGQLQTLALFCVRCGAARLDPVGAELPFIDPENEPKGSDSTPAATMQGGNSGHNAPDYF